MRAPSRPRQVVPAVVPAPAEAVSITADPWFLAGLFFTTLATLALELLDTRLLSVLTWYHLSFFAVSMAMFGMSAGAVHVYLSGERFARGAAERSLSGWALWLAIAIPASHVLNLVIPITIDSSLTSLTGNFVTTASLALPFYFSGIIVSLALTRVPGQIGLTYAVDLVGAGLGSLLVIPLLRWSNISSATFAVGGLAALGALCFGKFAGSGRQPTAVAVALILLIAAALNGFTPHGFRAIFVMGRLEPTQNVRLEVWNTYSQVIVRKPLSGPPRYWGASPKAPDTDMLSMPMIIDGSASTAMTQWDGRTESLDWVRYDVTSMPYHLRKRGTVGIIGIGGGRDVLTALWAESAAITGIEINGAFLRLLRGPLRKFSRIADQRSVELIHDEARSYLRHAHRRFDVLQMSLIDTWASTGAGAYTLSENGLYTLEAWRVFLDSLAPEGLFSVSRWFSPEKVSETSRLVALGTAALFDRGVTDPANHIALVSCQRVATFLVSTVPFSAADRDAIERTAAAYDFRVELAPGHAPRDQRLAAIVSSRSRADLDRVLADEPYDYTPPTDERPYFFNMVKPASLLHLASESSLGVMVHGNLLATAVLVVLAWIATVLVIAIILVPLLRAGLPSMEGSTFTVSVAYFALIGIGYMMMQVPLMQRFSVYLGHPTYSIAVVLFSMISATGVGSLVSDLLPVESQPLWLRVIPLTIAAAILSATFALQPAIDRTIQMPIFTRCLVAVAFTAPIALGLGFCFPVGMRLARRISSDAMPWMWGVNGACGVLASTFAVAISMWAGIHVSLYVASACYAGLAVAAPALWRAGETDR